MAKNSCSLDELLDQAADSESLVLDNQVLVTLPPRVLALPQLVSLDLSSNSLEALPEDLSPLRALTTLTLTWNKLERLPAHLGALPQLTHLHVGFNQLTELGPEVGALTALQELHANDNKLRAVAPELGAATGLRVLELSYNTLEHLPTALGDLTALQTLSLNGNPLKCPPLDVVYDGAQAIVAFLRRHRDRQAAPSPTTAPAPPSPTLPDPFQGDPAVGEYLSLSPGLKTAAAAEEVGGAMNLRHSLADLELVLDARPLAAADAAEVALDLATTGMDLARPPSAIQRGLLASSKGDSTAWAFGTDDSDDALRPRTGSAFGEMDGQSGQRPRTSKVSSSRVVVDIGPYRLSAEDEEEASCMLASMPAITYPFAAAASSISRGRADRSHRAADLPPASAALAASFGAGPLSGSGSLRPGTSSRPSTSILNVGEDELDCVRELLSDRNPALLTSLNDIVREDLQEELDLLDVDDDDDWRGERGKWQTQHEGGAERLVLVDDDGDAEAAGAAAAEGLPAPEAAGAGAVRAPVPPHFLCPITYEVMQDPVVLSDGHTYERRAIERWTQHHSTSPMTGEKLKSTEMTPNFTLRSLIQEHLQTSS